MHLLKHYLTEEEKNHLELYLQMINSNDFESNKLGPVLFFEEFKKYKIPFFGYKFCFLINLSFPNSKIYWEIRIKSLLKYNYYCY